MNTLDLTEALEKLAHNQRMLCMSLDWYMGKEQHPSEAAICWFARETEDQLIAIINHINNMQVQPDTTKGQHHEQR